VQVPLLNLDEAVAQAVRLSKSGAKIMNLTPESKVLIQGITELLSSTHAARMKAYGTNVIAGVNPGQVADLA